MQEAAEALRSDEQVTEAGRARVQWLRRLAHERGLALRRHLDQPGQSETGRGGWMIVDQESDSVVAVIERTGMPNLSLDEVEAWLTRR